MIKNSVVVFPEEIVVPLSFSIFSNKILYLYPQIVQLYKTYCKICLTLYIRLYGRLHPGIKRKKMIEINIFGHFSLRRPLKKFPTIILIDNNMTHLLKKYRKMFIMRGKISICGLLVFFFCWIFWYSFVNIEICELVKVVKVARYFLQLQIKKLDTLNVARSRFPKKMQ